MDYILLGKTIRAFRHQAKLTQTQLAEMADICPSYLGHIERATRILSLDTFVKLCRALHCSPNDLLPGFDTFQDEQDLAVRLLEAACELAKSRRP